MVGCAQVPLFVPEGCGDQKDRSRTRTPAVRSSGHEQRSDTATAAAISNEPDTIKTETATSLLVAT